MNGKFCDVGLLFATVEYRACFAVPLLVSATARQGSVPL